jgi:hypothetical protein
LSFVSVVLLYHRHSAWHFWSRSEYIVDSSASLQSNWGIGCVEIWVGVELQDLHRNSNMLG